MDEESADLKQKIWGLYEALDLVGVPSLGASYKGYFQPSSMTFHAYFTTAWEQQISHPFVGLRKPIFPSLRAHSQPSFRGTFQEFFFFLMLVFLTILDSLIQVLMQLVSSLLIPTTCVRYISKNFPQDLKDIP